MAINHGHSGDAGRNPGVEYDKSDLGAKGVLVFFVVLAIFFVAMHVAALAVYVGLTKIADKHEPEVSPLAPQTYTPRTEILTNTANVNADQFPEPRLLKHPSQKGLENRSVGRSGEMTDFLIEETAELTAKPWRDEQGNVRLPIDQAMKLVLNRLPVRAGSTAPPNYPGAARIYSYPGSAEAGSAETGAAEAGAPDESAPTPTASIPPAAAAEGR